MIPMKYSEYYLQVLLHSLTIIKMTSLVTSKGQVTVPKRIREQFGIEPGERVDFSATENGIWLRKVVDRKKQSKAFGCLNSELEGRAVADLLDELRGPVSLPAQAAKRKRR